MSKFYSELANYYVDIFPLADATLQFLKQELAKEKGTVLDIACGSGQYALALAQAGHAVTAIDLDDEMIHQLQRKSANIDARVLDMRNIAILKQQYDLLFCIGNSLVHLDSGEDILLFLNACYAALKPGGKLVLQIINYDRILDQQIDHLLTIHNQAVPLSFERNYNYQKELHKVEFHTRLYVKQQSYENRVLLYPLRSNELLSLIQKAGFQSWSFFGNFQRAPFDAQTSVPLVVTIQK